MEKVSDRLLSEENSEPVIMDAREGEQTGADAWKLVIMAPVTVILAL